MKRFLVVLTILVLVAGFAFAAISGSVEAKYKFDFLKETADYSIHGKNAKFTFSLSTESATSAGSNKPYATATVSIAAVDDVLALDEDLKYNDGAYTATLSFGDNEDISWVFKLSDFRIVGEDWEINLLKAIKVGNYAKSAWEVDSDDKAVNGKWNFSDTRGITVTYKGYKIGVHMDTKPVFGGEGHVTKADLRAETKEIALAEGVTVQAGSVLGYSKEGEAKALVNFGFSAKGAYVSDSVSANVAVDLQSVGKTFDADVAAAVEVAPVTVDAYYATKLSNEPTSALGTKDNYLSIRAIIDVAKIAENIPVKVTLYGQNLINDGRLLGIKEEGKFGKVSEDAQFGIYPSLKNAVLWFANATVGYDVAENVDVRVGAGLFDVVLKAEDDKFAFGAYAFNIGADYKHDLFTASADLYLAKEFAEEGSQREETDLLVSGKLSVSSDKLVDNAVLSANLVFNNEGAEGLYKSTKALDEFKVGSVTVSGTSNYLELSCKVSF